MAGAGLAELFLASWRRLVGWFLPPAADGRFQQRCFAVVQFFLIAALMGLAVLLAYAYLHRAPSLFELGSIFAGALSPLLGSLYLRHSARIDAAVVAVNAGGVAAVSAFALVTGGIDSPGIPLLFGFLIMAAGLGRGIVTLAVFAMNTAAVCTLYLLGQSGALASSRIPAENQAILDLLGLMVALALTAASLYALAAAWRRNRRRLTAALSEAQEANVAKTHFLAAMSHDLRTPLNAIIGFSQVMKSETYGPLGHPKYLEYAADVERSGQHLLHLVNELLDLSTVEASQIHLQDDAIDLLALLTGARNMLLESAARDGISIALQVPADLPLVRADETRLKQVFLNLMDNAVKYSRAGGDVSVHARHIPAQGLLVEVRDHGIGIARADLEKLRKPFVQLAGSGAGRRDGVGLGLFIATRLIELHGGTLRIDSDPGRGTRVTLTIPHNRLSPSAA